VLWAVEFAKVHKSTDSYIRNIDDLLVYLGRYGKQDITQLENKTTWELRRWAATLGRFLEEESRQAEEGR
jgi:hypothetical protein